MPPQSLKQKTISGVLWSGVDNMAANGVNFIVGIVLARLLSPRDFGLIGMITVFIVISQAFMDGGFSNALIRKKNCTQTDFSTVFIFNLVIGLLFYLLLFFMARPIGMFYNEPMLESMIKVLGLGVLIGSFSIIQMTILTRNIDFRLKTKISVAASLVSGIIAVVMAYQGFGVWSLVARSLIGAFISSFLLWLWNHWKPSLVFSWLSFHELFGFGSKLLVSSLIDTTYRNVYFLVIGKYFSAQQLGYYTHAHQFVNLPSHNLTAIISRVTFPVLAQIQDEPEKLKAAYKQMIQITMFVSFVLMFGMAAAAEPMVITLVGEVWRPSVVYLQMLCFVGMLFPLHALNLNMLNVQGRSDLFLRLEIIKKVLAIPTILVGIAFGIKVMIAGMMVNSVIAYFLNSYWSGRFIGYPMKEQVLDVLPSMALAAVMALLVYFAGTLLPFNYSVILGIQLLVGIICVVFFSELARLKPYQSIKKIAEDTIRGYLRGRK